MSTPNILVIQSDNSFSEWMVSILESQQYTCVVADTGKKGIISAISELPDLVLLNPILSDMDGIEIITQIRTWSHLPILVIGEHTVDQDIIRFLDAGADDYIVKPVSSDVLLARIRTALRRLHYMKSDDLHGERFFRNGGLMIDYESGCVYLDAQELHVTPIEYRLLCLLAKNVGKVLSHTYITGEIWGTNWENDVASLRVFMAALRKKLETRTDGLRYIQTHVGVGYRMLRME